jgi:hypothetical protein
MSVDFSKLKTAIVDVNVKFPGLVTTTNKNKNSLAAEFLAAVESLSDEQADTLDASTVILYNSMVEAPDLVTTPTEPPAPKPAPKTPVAATKPPSRSKPRGAKKSRVVFEGPDVSSSTRVTVFICDHPELSSSEITEFMLAEGRKISKSTIDVIYSEVHKVLDYLEYKGLIKLNRPSEDAHA